MTWLASHAVTSLTELLAVAYKIEVDAVERYTVLAESMKIHNSPGLARLFRDLANAEGMHAQEIRRRAGDVDVTADAARLGRLQVADSPEEAELDAAHYLMTPWHALQMALAAEQRALEFFSSVADSADDPGLRSMAAQFAEEEAGHVELVHRLLLKHRRPAGEAPWDPDPPRSQG